MTNREDTEARIVAMKADIARSVWRQWWIMGRNHVRRARIHTALERGDHRRDT